MKLAIISDTHLGYGYGSEREQESFDNAKQAFELAIGNGAEAILFAGDFFDSDIPSQETWHRTFELLKTLQNSKSGISEIKILDREGNERAARQKGLPVIAIHGTHEFRGRGYKNALEVLESAGFIIHIHASKAIIEVDGEKIIVHGLGGVPEKKALDALKAWAPEAEKNAYNILIFHQSLKEYLPFAADDEMSVTLSLDDLPKGFDLIVDGHFHLKNESTLANGAKFVIPGSTIITQMKDLESKTPKGIYIYDTQTRAFKFLQIPKQRKLFYEKLNFKDASAEEVLGKVEEKINSHANAQDELAPLIRIKISGSLKQGLEESDLSFRAIIEKFRGKALLSIDDRLSAAAFRMRIDELRALQQKRASVAELGLEILERNLAQTDFNDAFDPRELIELLSDKKREQEALAMLLGKHTKEEKEKRKESI